jgi:DNA-binding winged helix-turn-helix (wHTH) protein/TolB-like protein
MPDAPIAFGGFRFDPATGELSGSSGSTRLGPQPAQVLSILIAKRGMLVTRAELKDALWPDTVVEADQGLNFCIRQIRAALGDEGGEGRFIETLPRRGYRFVFALDEAAPTVRASATGSEERRRYGLLATITAGLVALVLGVAWMTASRAAVQDVKVAVLPMVPAADDPAWVADVDSRVTERLIDQLTAYESGAIGVVGPVTTSRYAGQARPHTEIGRELGVGYVMSGVVTASDSTVFVQLIRVSDGVHVFAFRRRVVGADLDSLAAAIVSGASAKLPR